MATHVYANGNEIASKSADGKSKAQGDVCHTPPPAASGPFPPGLPTAYPNTCLASDITNGSRTVFIVGKEIALEKKSYFSTSYGDEPATKGLAKGLLSGAVQGRCYFQTWSPDVKVEGLSVTRHRDMVSHNHKNPTNTALFPYLSRGWAGGHDCGKEETRIKDACSDKAKKPKRSKRFKQSSNNGTVDHWTKDFCTGLHVPTNVNPQELRENLEELLDTAHEQFKDISAGFWSYLTGAALHGAGKLALRSGARVATGFITGGGMGAATGVAGGPAAPATVPAGAAAGATVGTIVTTAISIGDLLWTLTDLPETIGAASAAGELYDRASAAFEKLNTVLDDQGNLNISDKDLPRLAGDLQDLLATINGCLRARKCNLVPHRNKTSNQRPVGSNVEPANDGGCCKGQQGHHLIPKAVMKNVVCPGYEDPEAPTVCVEGGRGSGGSHERIHNNFDAELAKKDVAGKVTADSKMSMKDAIEAAVASHQATFPLSRCREKCIKAQLTDYYNRLCRKASVNAVDQLDNKIKPPFPTAPTSTVGDSA